MSAYDPRFDEAEAEAKVGSARQWRNATDGGPNPITIEATNWIGPIDTVNGPVEILEGTDRNGQLWSVMVAGKILVKTLIQGLVEEWDDDKKAFVVKAELGKVKAGEVVSVQYNGKRKAGSGNEYSDYGVSRKAAVDGAATQNLGSAPVDTPTDDDIPFDDGVPD